MEQISNTKTLIKILDKSHFTVDYYQREYRWGRKQIEQMLSDFESTFLEFYDPDAHGPTKEVDQYGYYFMGSIITTRGMNHQIIDGQQRLTSLTLLLIYLDNLQKKSIGITGLPVNISSMIYSDNFGEPSFNIDVDERHDCLQALVNDDKGYVPKNESSQNMVDRYQDIEELFSEDLKTEALPYYIYWLTGKVTLLEIETPSEDEAHTIFLTMNDRGLSLNSAEMMKAFIIQQTSETDRLAVNKCWQENINRIKNGLSSGGIVNSEDVDFISVWLRAKYAQTLRETKKGAVERDFEMLGDKFHTWVRQNAKEIMKLYKSQDYYDFVVNEMTHITDLYLRLRNYSEKLDPRYAAVYYNAARDINYQIMLILSAVKTDDDEETINKKIQLVSEFVDDFASFRIFNYKRINWNTNKLILFHVMCKIRDKDIHTIGFHLTQTLEQMSEKIDGVVEFSLNQFTTRYMLHMLSRFTSYINIKVGYQSDFEKYIDRNSNTPYDIEHILPDDYESYREFFNDEEDFKNYRQKVGNLIILTRDKNRSYQDMNYSQKVEQYANDNILAQALNPLIYNNSPHFKQLVPLYGFKHIEQFDKEAIKSRADTYLRIAKDIWNIDHLKEIAGGWDIDPETLGSEKRYTFGYAERSWPDALKYGFLSANIDSTGKSIKNLSIGDKLFCYIRNKGFVGIGICTSIAVPMEQFMVTCDDGLVKPIADVGWIEEARKKELEQKQEWFVGVKWQQYVKSEDEGFRESDLTVIPMTVYTTKDNDTYDKVIEFFNKREK